MMYALFETGQWRLWFCLALGLAVVCALLMHALGFRLWRLKAEGAVELSVLDLEFPSTRNDLPRMLAGVFRMDDWYRHKGQPTQAVAALKGVLWADYGFMPGAYGALFLLNAAIARKFGLQTIGGMFFLGLAWAQGLAWLCDMLENAVALAWVMRVRRERESYRHAVEEAQQNLRAAPKRFAPSPMSKGWFRVYVSAVWVKWISALLGLAAALMLCFYFWLSGDYEASSLTYLLVVIAEVMVFVALAGWMKTRQKKEKSGV